jgi:anion-transporting  ArsA/GET3 family ATPase
MKWLSNPSQFFFFTGRVAGGKTSISSVAAISFAEAGKHVLLVSI